MFIMLEHYEGAHGVVVIVVENGHGYTSSNPIIMNPIILPPAMGK